MHDITKSDSGSEHDIAKSESFSMHDVSKSGSVHDVSKSNSGRLLEEKNLQCSVSVPYSMCTTELSVNWLILRFSL